MNRMKGHPRYRRIELVGPLRKEEYLSGQMTGTTLYVNSVSMPSDMGFVLLLPVDQKYSVAVETSYN